MKPLGWIFMISSWALITYLVIFSFAKILKKK